MCVGYVCLWVCGGYSVHGVCLCVCEVCRVCPYGHIQILVPQCIWEAGAESSAWAESSEASTRLVDFPSLLRSPPAVHW